MSDVNYHEYTVPGKTNRTLVVLQLVHVLKTLPHALRGEKDELPVALTSSNLQHHVHRYPTVHHVLVKWGDVDLFLHSSQITCSSNRVNHLTMKTSNSSRQRNGASVMAQRERMKQTVEKERSPPDSERMSLRSALFP